MTSHQLHERAAQLARARGISHSEALAAMARSGAAKRRRRRDHGRTAITPADQAAFHSVESPAPRYWWLRDN